VRIQIFCTQHLSDREGLWEKAFGNQQSDGVHEKRKVEGEPEDDA
jgi:hypothetical protein